MGLSTEGLDEFRAAFSRLRDKGPQRLSEATREYVEETLFPKTQEVVPKATGDLQGTGEVREGARVGGWAVHYGNSPVNNRSMVDYAAAVHEIPEHKHAPPTIAAFVKTPMEEFKDRHKEIAAQALDDLASGE
jgi:hypothetical protein